MISKSIRVLIKSTICQIEFFSFFIALFVAQDLQVSLEVFAENSRFRILITEGYAGRKDRTRLPGFSRKNRENWENQGSCTIFSSASLLICSSLYPRPVRYLTVSRPITGAPFSIPPGVSLILMMVPGIRTLSPMVSS